MGDVITPVRVLAFTIVVLGVSAIAFMAGLIHVTTSKAKEEGKTTQPVREDQIWQRAWWNKFAAFFRSPEEIDKIARGISNNDPVLLGCCSSISKMVVLETAKNYFNETVTIVQNVTVNGMSPKQLFYTETCDRVPGRCRYNCLCNEEDIWSQALVYSNRNRYGVVIDYIKSGKCCRCENAGTEVIQTTAMSAT